MHYLIALAFLMAHSLAPAAVVELSYTGQVSYVAHIVCTQFSNGVCSAAERVEVQTSDGFKGRVISIGDSFAGSLTYDTYTPPFPSGSQYYYFNLIRALRLEVGTLSIPDVDLPASDFGNSIAVSGEFPDWEDFYAAQSFPGINVELGLRHTKSEPFDGSLPTTFDLVGGPDYSQLTVSSFDGSNGDGFYAGGPVEAVITSVKSSIPEPSVLCLLLTGGLGLLAASRARVRTTRREA